MIRSPSGNQAGASHHDPDRGQGPRAALRACPPMRQHARTDHQGLKLDRGAV